MPIFSMYLLIYCLKMLLDDDISILFFALSTSLFNHFISLISYSRLVRHLIFINISIAIFFFVIFSSSRYLHITLIDIIELKIFCYRPLKSLWVICIRFLIIHRENLLHIDVEVPAKQ